MLSITGFGLIDYRFPWLSYIGIIGPVYLFTQVRRMIKTDALQNGYKRLVNNEAPLKFPEDDFL
jgi:hypothetical protein